MATVVNNPPAQTDSGSGSGYLLGVILFIIFVILFVFYGLPLLANSGLGQNSGTPQINVPGKVDVNVNQSKPK